MVKIVLFLSASIIGNCIFAQQKSYSNINYIDLENNKIHSNVSLKIKNNGKVKIVAKAKNAIDAQGQYLMPALYDMHIHWPDTLTLATALAWKQAGVANARIMKSNAATMKEKIFTDDLGIATSICFPFYKATVVTNANSFVDSIKKAGYHFIKFFSVQNETVFIEIANAAKKAKMPICGHALGNVRMQVAFENGYRSVEHVGYLEPLNGTALDSAIALFKQYNVAVCPTIDWTMTAYGALTKDSLLTRSATLNNKSVFEPYWQQTYKTPTERFGADASKYSDRAKSILAKRQLILKKLHEAGVLIIAGSDAEEAYQTPGFSLIEELKWIASAGLSNWDVLKTATTNAKQYWKQNGKVKLTPKFILIKDNPITDINALYQSKILQ